jgi:hypothetical protein
MSLKSTQDEIHGYSTNYSACNYQPVAQQCGAQRGLRNLRSNGANPTAGAYVVPTYSAIGYDALTHGNAGGGCNNYFNIEQAYGAGAGSCSTSYAVRACGGCAGGAAPVQNAMRYKR